MTSSRPFAGLFWGDVVHTRLRPRRHKLRYRVFSLLVDLDRLEDSSRYSRFFSFARFNLLSLHTRDHGNGSGESLVVQARRALRDADLEHAGCRIEMLCYPRLLGYAFNPLTVYFCFGADERLAAVIYEVNNRVSERISYVVPAGGNCASDTGARPLFTHQCSKQMYVSPFTPQTGTYHFHVQPPADDILVGVAMSDQGGAILKTHFRGQRMDLNDRNVLAVCLQMPLLTLKVTAAIHYEALKLMIKGVPLQPRFRSPAYRVATTGPDRART